MNGISIPPNTSIADGIRFLVEDGFCESIFVTIEEQQLLGVVSYIDIIAYRIPICSMELQQQKTKPCPHRLCTVDYSYLWDVNFLVIANSLPITISCFEPVFFSLFQAITLTTPIS